MWRFASFIMAASLAVPAAAAELVIPGAGPPTTVVSALANAFNARAGKLRVEVPPSSGMSGALDAVRSSQAVLARMPRQLTPQEQREGLAQTVIARELIVFATGADVSVTSLSRAELAAAFAGQITDWRQLGGRSGPIRVFYREETAWTLRVIRERLPEFTRLRFSEQGRLIHLDPELTEQLQRFGWGLGWGSLGNIRAAPGLRLLALDGVVPSDEALLAGHYPLAYDVVLIHKSGALPGVAREFVEFVASAAGRAVIEALDAVPALPAATRQVR